MLYLLTDYFQFQKLNQKNPFRVEFFQVSRTYKYKHNLDHYLHHFRSHKKN